MNTKKKRIVFFNVVAGVVLLLVLIIVTLSGTSIDSDANSMNAFQGTTDGENYNTGTNTSSTSITSGTDMVSSDSVSAGTPSAGTGTSPADETSSDSKKSLPAAGSTMSENEAIPSSASKNEKITAISEKDYQEMEDSVNAFHPTVEKTLKNRINPLMLSISGLEPDYNAMMAAMSGLDDQIQRFNDTANSVTPSDITDKDIAAVKQISSDLEKIKAGLDEKQSLLKASMKQKDIDAVGTYMTDITGIANSASSKIGKLCNIMVE